MQLHQWLGRLIAILGIVQIALGMTLWGSPKVLFILYAIWGFILLAAWFILSYLNQPEMGFDDRGTYITDTTRTSSYRSRSHGGLGAIATAGAAGAGLAALRSRSRSRRRPSGSRTEALSSHPGTTQLSESYVSEKYTEDERKGRTWRDRLLGAGAAAGGILAIKSLFNRKKHAPTETGSDVTYSRPIGPSEVTQTDLSRLEEGRAPASPGRDHWRRVEDREAAQAAAMGASPLRQGHHPTRSGVSIDSSGSRTSFSTELERPKESHGLRNGIAALGFAGFLKHQWNKRRSKGEDEHVAAMKRQDYEEERIARANSQRRNNTGGMPPRRNRPPSTIISESDISGTTPALSRPNLPPPPTGPGAGSTITSVPPVVDPQGVLSDSGSEAYMSGGGRTHRRHGAEGKVGTGALATGAAAAVLLADIYRI